MDIIERQKFHEKMVAEYRELFSHMDLGELASWFISMEESVILSFEVHSGESHAQAEDRHDIEVMAIATALSGHPCAPKLQETIEGLRNLASAGLARQHDPGPSPTHDLNIERVKGALRIFDSWRR